MIAFSLIALCLCSALFLIGMGFFLLPLFPNSFYACASLFQQEEFFRWIGCGMIALSIIVTILFLVSQRKRFWRIKAGIKKTSIDLEVIKQITKLALEPIFPQKSVECEVMTRIGNELEIYLNLPFCTLEKQPLVLKKIEPLLTSALEFHCGYEKEYILNASFEKEGEFA